jgi:uncharacterized protein
MDQKEAHDITKQYLTFVSKNGFQIVKAFLFGSHAKGSQHEDSDIDLAVVLTQFDNSFDTEMQLTKLTRNIDIRIEPHLFDVKEFNASHPFAREILQHGIEIV